MYAVSVEVKESAINGRGVFAMEGIPKGSIVWRYTKGHDRKMTTDEFDQLDEFVKIPLMRIAYLSPTTHMWVMPPEDDPACYTNHDQNEYNTSVIFDENI